MKPRDQGAEAAPAVGPAGTAWSPEAAGRAFLEELRRRAVPLGAVEGHEPPWGPGTGVGSSVRWELPYAVVWGVVLDGVSAEVLDRAWNAAEERIEAARARGEPRDAYLVLAVPGDRTADPDVRALSRRIEQDGLVCRKAVVCPAGAGPVPDFSARMRRVPVLALPAPVAAPAGSRVRLPAVDRSVLDEIDRAGGATVWAHSLREQAERQAGDLPLAAKGSADRPRSAARPDDPEDAA